MIKKSFFLFVFMFNISGEVDAQRVVESGYKNHVSASVDFDSFVGIFSKIFFQAGVRDTSGKFLLNPWVVKEKTSPWQHVFSTSWKNGDYNINLRLIVNYHYNSIEIEYKYGYVISRIDNPKICKRVSIISMIDTREPKKHRDLWSSYSSKPALESVVVDYKEGVLINSSYDFDGYNFFKVLSDASKKF